MFGSRRHAPPLQPLTRETANPSAATAAASAFGRRGSNASLSSAAAAAALRARPATPTNVAEVQTKRTHRRSASVSSQTSRDRRPHRSSSVGSMTDRTFRSPSPGPSPVPPDPHVPPVPSLPSHVHVHERDADAAPRKPAALQTLPFRTASEKMKDGQPGSWFGGATTGDPANIRGSGPVPPSASAATAATAAAAAVPEPRPGSVSPSINFSYPRARMQSPEPPLDDQTPVYDANSRRMVPRSELLARTQSLHDSTEKPKKKKADHSRTGSHLSRGTVGRTRAASLDQPQIRPLEQAPILPTESRTTLSHEELAEPLRQKKKKNRKKQTEASKLASVGDQNRRQDTPDKAHPPSSNRPSAADREPGPGVKASQSAPPLATIGASAAADQSPRVAAANAPARNLEAIRPGSGARFAREPSESPARSAHFASAPDQLVVRHEPPPRSVSPKKSALKLSSPRDASPSDDESEVSERHLSPPGHDDRAASRKKSPRVSWDDSSTVVVGESSQVHDTETPFLPSPQARKPWHSIVTKYGKKDAKDPVNLSEDETMSPRPALPLFGSVREKKSKECEERPLVRPAERSRSPTAPPTAAGPSEASPEPDLEQSSDAAGVATLSHDQASRNAANISKYREPLPASMPLGESSAKESTFVESSSDDDIDTDATTEPDVATEPDADMRPEEAPETTMSKGTAPQLPDPGPDVGDEPAAVIPSYETVPTISVSLPSPGFEKPREIGYRNDQPDLPGSFPEDDDFTDGDQSLTIDAPVATTFQNTAAASSSRFAESSSIASNAVMDDIEEEEEESDRLSMYSDAYEDLDAVDGDGFMSLDAIVESPAKGKAKESPAPLATKLMDGPHERTGSPALATRDEASQSGKDWENAKAYWRSLSTDQRRLLEVEALSDDSDGEEKVPTQRVKQGGKRQAVAGHSKEAPQPHAADERKYQIKPGSKWREDASSNTRAVAAAKQSGAAGKAVPKIRRSMRGEEPEPAQTELEQPGGMRKSMRASAPSPVPASSVEAKMSRRFDADTNAAASAASMRKSLRDRGGDDNPVGSRPSLARTNRPSSYHPPEAIKSHKMRKRNLSVEDFGSRGHVRPSLVRQGSDDSASSFTRSRASPGPAHGFRMSMRSGFQDASPPRATKGSGRFSLRSMSPPAFRRSSITSLPGTPTLMGAGGRMRNSMRSEAAPSTPKTRLSPFKRSPRAQSGAKAKPGSRFADSSDEDEAGPSLFSSRFADSSDDEDVPMTQPRGKKGKGMAKSMRSANQPSSLSIGGGGAARAPASLAALRRNDNAAQAPKRASLGVDKASGLHRSGSGRGTLMPLHAAPSQGETKAAPPARPRRGSIMSILRRKKDTPTIARDVSESAARRDTRLERSPDELSAVRSHGQDKRGPGWPLVDGEPEADADADAIVAQHERHVLPLDSKMRPSTAGGPLSASKAKTMAFHRRNTSLGTSALGAHGGSDSGDGPPPQQKKKKFGALRKMFGIGG